MTRCDSGILLVILAAGLGCTAVRTPDTAGVPVRVGVHASLDACLSLAVPILADPVERLPVRSGPGSRFPVTDQLSPDDRFFVCNPSDDQSWIGIVYPDRHAGMVEGECGVSSPSPGEPPHTGPYTGPCKSGWIPADAFEVIAG